jgi:hypothetical protein
MAANGRSGMEQNKRTANKRRHLPVLYIPFTHDAFSFSTALPSTGQEIIFRGKTRQ